MSGDDKFGHAGHETRQKSGKKIDALFFQGTDHTYTARACITYVFNTRMRCNEIVNGNCVLRVKVKRKIKAKTLSLLTSFFTCVLGRKMHKNRK